MNEPLMSEFFSPTAHDGLATYRWVEVDLSDLTKINACLGQYISVVLASETPGATRIGGLVFDAWLDKNDDGRLTLRRPSETRNLAPLVAHRASGRYFKLVSIPKKSGGTPVDNTYEVVNVASGPCAGSPLRSMGPTDKQLIPLASDLTKLRWLPMEDGIPFDGQYVRYGRHDSDSDCVFGDHFERVGIHDPKWCEMMTCHVPGINVSSDPGPAVGGKKMIRDAHGLFTTAEDNGCKIMVPVINTEIEKLAEDFNIPMTTFGKSAKYKLYQSTVTTMTYKSFIQLTEAVKKTSIVFTDSALADIRDALRVVLADYNARQNSKDPRTEFTLKQLVQLETIFNTQQKKG